MVATSYFALFQIIMVWSLVPTIRQTLSFRMRYFPPSTTIRHVSNFGYLSWYHPPLAGSMPSMLQKQLIIYHQNQFETTNYRTYTTRFWNTPSPSDSSMPMDSAILDGLNPSQIEATTKPTSSITRVVAGPGSGKTKVLTCRIAYLLEEDIHSRVLAVTFTRKAAGEMQTRLENLLRRKQQQKQQQYPRLRGREEIMDNHSPDGMIVDEDYGEIPSDLQRVTLGTFHSICAKILRWNGELLASLPYVDRDMSGSTNATNLDSGFAIVDQPGQLRLVNECLKEANIDLKDTGVKPISLMHELSRFKEEYSRGMDPFKKDNKKILGKAVKITGEIYPLYRQKLFANNAVDFDDLILMTRDLLTVHRDIRERLNSRWRHILVDEFQDTSRTQMDLVKLLTTTSLFVVGDADQSIYSWRGAHVGSLAEFPDEFRHCVGTVDTVHLMENYRSTTNIVMAAQKVISSAKSNTDMRQSMKPRRGSGPTPRVVACDDSKAEAKFVVDTVFGLLKEGQITNEDTVAFIYRTNAQSRSLEEACVEKNLPYVVRGSGGFYKRAEIQDCLCFLRWLHNGYDKNSMIRAMKTPSRGIGEVAIGEFSEYCNKVALYYQENLPSAPKPTPLDILISFADNENKKSIVAEAPEASGWISTRAMKNLVGFSHQMRAIREEAYNQPVEGLLSFIIESLGLVSHFDSISKSAAEFEERRENVQELRRAAKKHAKDIPSLASLGADEEYTSGTALANFLDDVALVADLAQDDTDTSSTKEKRLVANLMTIHAAKGMEFDVVFIVGNEDGTLPLSKAIVEGEGSVPLEEEKRLCYVAMTRAKTHLIMTWRKEVASFAGWTGGIKTTNKGRSRFLDAIVKKKKKTNTKPTQIDSRTITATKQTALSEKRMVRPSGQRRNDGARIPTRSSSSSNNNNNNNNPYRSSSAHRSSSYGGGSNFQRRQGNGISRRDYSTSTASSSSPSRSMTKREYIDSYDNFQYDLNSFPQDTRPTRNYNNGTNKSRPSMNTARTPRSQYTSTTNGRTEQTPRKTTPTTGQEQPTGINRIPDSTWIYPVGSAVKHSRLGNGIILNPPPTRGNQPMVRVQFDNGQNVDFPLSEPDLFPRLRQ